MVPRYPITPVKGLRRVVWIGDLDVHNGVDDSLYELLFTVSRFVVVAVGRIRLPIVSLHSRLSFRLHILTGSITMKIALFEMIATMVQP